MNGLAASKVTLGINYASSDWLMGNKAKKFTFRRNKCAALLFLWANPNIKAMLEYGTGGCKHNCWEEHFWKHHYEGRFAFLQIYAQTCPKPLAHLGPDAQLYVLFIYKKVLGAPSHPASLIIGNNHHLLPQHGAYLSFHLQQSSPLTLLVTPKPAVWKAVNVWQGKDTSKMDARGKNRWSATTEKTGRSLTGHDLVLESPGPNGGLELLI